MKWEQAYRISDQITDMFQREVETVSNDAESPMSILAGYLLAWVPLQESMPRDGLPPIIVELDDAIRRSIKEIAAVYPVHWNGATRR